MKERPILLSGEMVRAILEGRKTQTRRVIKPQPYLCEKTGMVWKGSAHGLSFNGEKETIRNFYKGLQKTNTVTNGKKKWQFCPYGKVGDRLWGRESFCTAPVIEEDDAPYLYMADMDGLCLENIRWKPSIHMPREASRILLEITDIRVERLNDISALDICSEGIEPVKVSLCGRNKNIPEDTIQSMGDALLMEAFAKLWESINGAGSWNKNPWVWVIQFKKI